MAQSAAAHQQQNALDAVIDEISQLKLSIAKDDGRIKQINRELDDCDTDHSDTEFGYVEEPSTFTCEARRYGRFECTACSNKWGSAFAYQGFSQECFKCYAPVIPTFLEHIEKTRARRQRYKVPPSHSYQFCEACEHGQCAWRPEALRSATISTTKKKKKSKSRRQG